MRPERFSDADGDANMNSTTMRKFSLRLWKLFFATAVIIGSGVVVGGDVSVGKAEAQEFRIDNKVFEGKTQIGGSTTIFAAKTYDFLIDGPESLIYDAETQRFTLLDDSRKARCELTTEQVAEFCSRLAERAKSSDSSYARFMGNPDFATEFDAAKRELTLNSAFMVYRAKTVAAPDTESLRRYQDFTYRQAQLNTVLVPGSQPPLARLKLHAALAERQEMAEEVSLKRATVIPNFSKLIRAEHKFTWTLDDADRKRIAAADEDAATYTVMAPAEFLKPTVAEKK